MPPPRHRRDRQTSVSKTNAVRRVMITTTTQAPMLLKNLVRTGTLLAGARAFAPLAVQRRAFTKMSAAPIGVMVTVTTVYLLRIRMHRVNTSQSAFLA